MQRIWLGDMGTACTFHGVSSTALCIDLQGADLVGKAAVGACVSVFGTTAPSSIPDVNAVRAWTEIQVSRVKSHKGF